LIITLIINQILCSEVKALRLRAACKVVPQFRSVITSAGASR